MKRKIFIRLAAVLLAGSLCSCRQNINETAENRRRIAASDTIISGMCETLLPAEHFVITAILPPGQCPGHYDLKLSDIAAVERADLILSFQGLPFMKTAVMDADKRILIDAQGRNWMAPDSYINGLNLLAGLLSGRFPEFKMQIASRKGKAVSEIEENQKKLKKRIQDAGIAQKTILAASMIKEPLEWMGFQIAGEYGRPESVSAADIVSLIRTGREKTAVMVVDNLQSGPDTGRGVAESLGIPHVVISNFPMEGGYLATLADNVNALADASRTERKAWQ